ncbi:MAG: FliO/MopB family protein [Bythopirellula sp.]
MLWLDSNLRLLRAMLVIAVLVFLAQTGRGQVLESWKRESPTASSGAAPAKVLSDTQVVAAQAVAAPPATTELTNPNKRILAPPTRSQIAALGAGRTGSQARPNRPALPNIESFTTAGAGLAIVLGLFLVCMWLLRRSGPKPTSPLPQEAVAVLGRIPLAARNFAHLLQVGNKLVLVAITPDGVSPITEISDPGEVQRVLGLCSRGHKHSTTAEFHNVLEQLAKEPASGFLGNEVAASYSSQRR